MRRQMFMFLSVVIVVLARPVWANTAPSLEPFEALLKCADEIRLEAPSSRETFLNCAKPKFAKEVDSRLTEMLAFWIASGPIMENLRVCSPEEAKIAGDRHHSNAIGCFETMDYGRVKTGYIFLRHHENRWFVLDIKY